MIPIPLRAVVRTLRLAAVAGLVGFALLAAAIAIASARYGDCGPSTLSAAMPGCALGARMLVAAYVALSAALVLGATSLSLLWRERRARRRDR